MRHAALALLLILAGSACTKESGDAVVLEKEHIDAREPSATVTPTPIDSNAAASEAPSAAPEYIERELAADEVTVNGFVMKKAVRGTSQDPRAATEEQWRVDVRMSEDGRRLTVHTNGARYEKLKPGDRVRVRYRKGKYTGTVWSAEIVD